MKTLSITAPLAGVLAGVVVAGGLVTATAPEASAAPDTVRVSSAKFATSGGHGNFRFRYGTAKRRVCTISPTGRSYTVRCAAGMPKKSKAAAAGLNAVEIGPKGKKRLKADRPTGPAKRLRPGQEIKVVGITCTAAKNATVTCKKGKRSFRIAGGVLQR